MQRCKVATVCNAKIVCIKVVFKTRAIKRRPESFLHQDHCIMPYDKAYIPGYHCGERGGFCRRQSVPKSQIIFVHEYY